MTTIMKKFPIHLGGQLKKASLAVPLSFAVSFVISLFPAIVKA